MRYKHKSTYQAFKLDNSLSNIQPLFDSGDLVLTNLNTGSVLGSLKTSSHHHKKMVSADSVILIDNQSHITITSTEDFEKNYAPTTDFHRALTKAHEAVLATVTDATLKDFAKQVLQETYQQLDFSQVYLEMKQTYKVEGCMCDAPNSVMRKEE